MKLYALTGKRERDEKKGKKKRPQPNTSGKREDLTHATGHNAETPRPLTSKPHKNLDRLDLCLRGTLS